MDIKRRGASEMSLTFRCSTVDVVNLRSLTLFSLTLHLLCAWTSEAVILVISKDTNEVVNKFKSETGIELNFDKSYKIRGPIVNSIPVDACQLPLPAPRPFSDSRELILLSKRSDCDFDTKILNAQKAGYSAIIIYNDESNSTVPMFVPRGETDNYTIFACFVGRHDGKLLQSNYTYDKGFIVELSSDDKFEINWWFILIMALCVAVCVMVFVLCFRLAWYFSVVSWERIVALRDDFQRFQRERRRAKRNRLFAAALKSLPAQKWNAAQLSESCAVCVEEFFEDDELRILSCNHGFHLSCIDEWLINGRRDCPVCKRKVLLENHDMFSNTDSDTDDETAPLLSTSHSQYGIVSGHTSLRRENPFLRGNTLNIQQAPEDIE